ncbi:MAG: fibronectin type III domain-containing protein [Actinomycetota bacterium]
MALPRALAIAVLALVLGAGVAHAASPGPPTALVLVPGDARITITWKAPPVASGTPPVAYEIVGTTVLPGAALPANDRGVAWGAPAANVPAGTSKYVLGLDPAWALFNGETYWIAVRAVDAAGTKSVRNPIAATIPFGPPGAPSIRRTTAGDGTIAVLLAPGDANGSPIIDYTVTASGGASCTSTAAAATCTLSGLATGSYDLRACSRNAAGTSPVCTTRTAIAVTSSAASGGGGASGGGSSGGGSSPTTSGGPPVTSASPTGTASVTVAAAAVRRTQRAIVVSAPITATGLSALTLRVTAKTGRRTVGTCTAALATPADGATTLTCRLGKAARAALRKGPLRLTIAAQATPADGSAALTATRTQRAARG